MWPTQDRNLPLAHQSPFLMPHTSRNHPVKLDFGQKSFLHGVGQWCSRLAHCFCNLWAVVFCFCHQCHLGPNAGHIFSSLPCRATQPHFHTILSPNFVTTSRAAMPLLIVHGNACSGFAFQDKRYTTLLCWLTRVEDFHRHVAQKYLDKP